MTTVIHVDHASKGFILRRGRSLKEVVVLVSKGRALTDSFQAIDDLSLTIEQGETVGLLGLNGSGKSTLLKLISGVMRPDSGTVRVRGRVAGLIEVGAGMHPDLTGRENIFLNGAILGMSEAELRRQFDSIVDFSEIETFLETEVKFYSSGMFLRLAFSVAVHTEPDVFLVDEILAVGDEPFQRKCLARIKQLSDEGRTLIVVSHDIDTVAEVCGRGILLDHGHKIVDGSFDEAVVRLRRP